MRPTEDLSHLKNSLFNYAFQASKYALPVDDGVLAAYSLELDIPFNVERHLDDLADISNTEAQAFLHISDHWLGVRREFPSGIVAFKELLPSLIHRKVELSHTVICNVHRIIRSYRDQMVEHHAQLENRNKKYIKDFMRFRIKMLGLRGEFRVHEDRRSRSLGRIILPCLLRLGTFLQTAQQELLQVWGEWNMFQEQARKSVLHLSVDASNGHRWTVGTILLALMTLLTFTSMQDGIFSPIFYSLPILQLAMGNYVKD